MERLKALQEIREYTQKRLNIPEAELNPLRTHDYLFFFKSEDAQHSNFWEVCNSPLQLEAGDLIVYLDKKATSHRHHCMIVKEIIFSNEDSIKFRVADSSQYLHKEDSRTIDEEGIGCGEIMISQTDDGNWNQIYWQSDADLDFKGIRDMAFARFR